MLHLLSWRFSIRKRSKKVWAKLLMHTSRWKVLPACWRPDKWKMENLSTKQLHLMHWQWKFVVSALIALIECLKSDLEQWPEQFGNSRNIFLAIVSRRMTSVSLGRAWMLLTLYQSTHVLVKLEVNLWVRWTISGFVMFSGGTLSWYVTQSKLPWIVRWQCYHCHISGNQLFINIWYVNFCILH